jgi:hypothetical protein
MREFRAMRQALQDDVEREGILTLVPLSEYGDHRRYELTAHEKSRLRRYQGHACGFVRCETPNIKIHSHNSQVTHTAGSFASMQTDFLWNVPRRKRWKVIKKCFGGAIFHTRCHERETRREQLQQCEIDAAAIVKACGLTQGSGLHSIWAFPDHVQKCLAETWCAGAGRNYEWCDGRVVWQCTNPSCSKLGAVQTDRGNVFSYRLARINARPSVAPTLVPPVCLARKRPTKRRNRPTGTNDVPPVFVARKRPTKRRGATCRSLLAAVRTGGGLGRKEHYARSGDFSSQTVQQLVARQIRRHEGLLRRP